VKSFRVLPWIAILAIAIGLRVYGLRYGLPAVYNPDEVAIMSRALAFAKRDLNPHNFVYPSFYFYLLFAWEGLTMAAAVAAREVQSLAAFQREFFLDPTRVFVAGRVLTAILGTATVLATGALTSRVAGPTAGLVAALVLAVSPLHVLNSHYVKHDVPVTLLIVLACLAYEELWHEPRIDRDSTKWVIIAGAVTGLAFSTHYYTIFLAVPLAWSAARPAYSTRDAMRRIAIAGIVSGIVFFLGSPFILAEPAIALRDMQANRRIVLDRAAGELGYVASASRYVILLLRDAVGIPAAVLALVGLGYGLRRQPITTLRLVAFPMLFLLFVFSTYPASRYLVPLTPFLALFAGVAVAEWGKRGSALRPLAIAAVVICAGVAALECVRTDRFIRQADTRTLAREFIEREVPPGSTILTQPYSVPLEPTAASIREALAVSGKEMPTKTKLQIERVPYPAPAFRLIYLGYGLDADKLYFPLAQLQSPDLRSVLDGEHVAFVVLKRYNTDAPATLPLMDVLVRQGRRIAVFAPYRGNAAGAVEPFLHNTDARITAALERPGPTVEIWQLNGSGS
jgi:hypothetical protein